MTPQKKLKKIDELDELYNRAAEVDKPIFAEMKTNILLVNNEHYKKVQSGLDRNLRSFNVAKTKRLRLTKNHTQKITSDIKDIFSSQISDYTPIPRNESETSDVKAAELNRAVWISGKEKINWYDLKDRFVDSFVDIGEVAAKVFFDPNQGELRGYEQLLNDEGQPVFLDAQGNMVLEPVDMFGNEHQPAADESKPQYKGKVCVEYLYPFNLKRDPAADNMKESPYLIYEKMMDVNKAKKLFAADDEDLARKITETSDTTYKIFDTNTGSFHEAKNQLKIREFYFRACMEYPKGYYYICTDNDILVHDELPLGEAGEIAFPIKHEGYDLISTSPRFASPIRPLRQLQVEVNRMASSEAETQLTVGHDKMILSAGATYSKGADLPGIRVIKVAGPAPQVIEGKSGSQFVSSLERTIREMYQVSKLPENESSAAQVGDPRAELFKNARQRARFTRPMGRLERFGKSIVESYLFFCQSYMPEDEVIRATGKKEAVNIAEFKSVDRNDFQIKVESVSNDFDSMFGKQVELEIIAQYFGKDLPMDIKAALIKNFPFLNKDRALKQVLVDFESPENMVLALDRGEEFVPNKYDDSAVMLKRLFLRMREADFKMLDPEIQQRYEMVVQAYQQIEKQQAEEMLRAQKGMIPTGGGLCKVDYYVNDVNSKGNITQKRATIPTDTIEWILKQLEDQGLAQERLAELPPAFQADLVNQIPQDAFVNADQMNEPQQGDMNGYGDPGQFNGQY